MKAQESYQLLHTTLKDKYLISTMYRQASTIEPMWYFETIAWNWDKETKKRVSIVEMDDSGISEEIAIINHMNIVQKLNSLQ